MPTFEATMRVTHVETWTVEAKDEDDARKQFSDFSEAVQDDDSGGEVVDWEVYKIKEVDQ